MKLGSVLEEAMAKRQGELLRERMGVLMDENQEEEGVRLLEADFAETVEVVDAVPEYFAPEETKAPDEVKDQVPEDSKAPDEAKDQAPEEPKAADEAKDQAPEEPKAPEEVPEEPKVPEEAKDPAPEEPKAPSLGEADDYMEEAEELQLMQDDQPATISANFQTTAQELFQRLDKSGDGLVSKSELKKGIMRSKSMRSALGLFNYSQCARFVEDADADGSGNLDVGEFRSFLSEREAALDKFSHEKAQQHLEASEVDPKIIEVTFKEIDANGDGRLDFHELGIAYAALLWKLGRSVDRKKVRRWVAKALRKHGGGAESLDITQFKEMAMQSVFASVLESKE